MHYIRTWTQSSIPTGNTVPGVASFERLGFWQCSAIRWAVCPPLEVMVVPPPLCWINQSSEWRMGREGWGDRVKSRWYPPGSALPTQWRALSKTPIPRSSTLSNKLQLQIFHPLKQKIFVLATNSDINAAILHACKGKALDNIWTKYDATRR